MQAKPALEVWMSTRKKAVVDMPVARAHHAGAIFGAGLFINGGLGGESHKTLSDWRLFDFGLQVWMDCIVEELMPDESRTLFDYERKYHSMTPVVEPDLTNGKELTRLIWNTPLKGLIKSPNVMEHGIFMFGGTDNSEMP